jgi:hypothetical protein
MVLSGIHGLVILMNNTQISNGSETAWRWLSERRFC